MRLEFEEEDILLLAANIAKLISMQPCNYELKDNTFFDVTGLARYLKVSKKWIYERTHLKEIPHVKIDGKLLFIKENIDKWVRTHSIPAVR